MLSSIRSNITNTPIYKNMLSSAHSAQQRALNLLPDKAFSGEKIKKAMDYLGKNFSSDKQRLALGVTALVTQPIIDAHNKAVDDKTRKVSVARTIAKIIAGTFTGFFIRYGCIKSIKAFSQIPAKGVKKYKTIFTPKNVKDNTTDAFEQYRNAMGTIVALGVMVFTNFLIDVPLTKFLTNVFVKNQEDKK